MTRLLVTVSCVLLVWTAAAAHPEAADLQAATAAAFARYVKLTEARIDQEMRGTLPFLWIETLPEVQRREADRRLRRGEIVTNRLETRDSGGSIRIPDGLCHHWVGTVFVAGVGLERTAKLMQSYDQYQDIYRPAVRRSQTLSRDGDHFKISLQLFMKEVMTSVVLNTEYDVRVLVVAPTRVQVRSTTTRIAEVKDPDTPQEQEEPVGHDNGFLWRFNNYCALEERGDGTYVQCESVSLSRNIPSGLGWLVGPFVTSIPKESLDFTLGTMRTTLTKGR